MKPFNRFALFFLSSFLANNVMAGDLVAAPGATSIGASISHTSFDQFYAGDDLQPEVPGGGEIERTSLRLYAEHGVGQDMSIDLSAGYADTSSGITEDNDFTDVQIGFNWQFADEQTSLADWQVRAGLNIAGDYETGRLSAPGDGENGIDISTRAVRTILNGVTGEFQAGYTFNDGDVPDSYRLRVGPRFELGSGIALDFTGIYFSGIDGIDIGGEGFSGLEDLPKVEEEGLVGEVGITINGNFGFYRFSASQLFDGANIGEELTFGLYTGFGF